jgi:hypothetical protein
MNEVDCVFAGLLGGFIGSSMVLFTARFYWKRMTREYEDAKRTFQDHLKIIDARERLKKIEEFLYLSLQYSAPYTYATKEEIKAAGDKVINKYKESINNLKDR